MHLRRPGSVRVRPGVRGITRGTASYTNDENGNTLTDGAANRTMTWDAQNRMVSCAFNGTTSTFTYGADGLRRRMVTGANTTDYLLDGQSVVREIKNGVVNATYLNGPRGPEYKRDQNGAVAWYLYDGLGSVVGLVDESGNVTNSRKYDVYGAPRNAQTGSAHCFVGGLGHTSDAETGLIYMRARYMDPATGRFVSEDPARDGDNWYQYANADPVNAVDCNGRVAAYVIAMVIGAAGAIGGYIGNQLAKGEPITFWGVIAAGGAGMIAGLMFFAFASALASPIVTPIKGLRELAGQLITASAPGLATAVMAVIAGICGFAGGGLMGLAQKAGQGIYSRQAEYLMWEAAEG